MMKFKSLFICRVYFLACKTVHCEIKISNFIAISGYGDFLNLEALKNQLQSVLISFSSCIQVVFLSQRSLNLSLHPDSGLLAAKQCTATQKLTFLAIYLTIRKF